MKKKSHDSRILRNRKDTEIEKKQNRTEFVTKSTEEDVNRFNRA